jgi:signal transduction histidine kinase
MKDIKKLIKFSSTLNVLYVEDDKDVQSQTNQLLQNFFKDIDLASNGQEALDKYKNFYYQNNRYYDIIISDLNMPVMDGFLMSEEMKSINPSQKIIIITAFSETEVLRKCIDLNVDKFISKPIKTLPIFLEQLKSVIVNIQNEYELQKLKKEIETKEKMETISTMLNNIAHQWRQPLSVISTLSTGISMKKELGILDDEEFYSACSNIDETTQFLSRTIDNFTNYINGETKPVSFDIKNDINNFVKLIDTTIKNYNIHVIVDLEEHIEIKGFPNELIQCFISIFNNAKEALVSNNIPEDERYILISQIINKENVILEFKDNAGGISEDIMGKIFEPYFTTKHKSQGTGLGLHMTYFLVNNMGGSIEVENIKYEFNNKEYKGALFRITLPLN